MSGGLDLVRARVALRDRSLADVLDLALRFIAVEARTYAKVALVSIVPMTLVSAAVGYSFGWRAGWGVGILLAISAETFFTVLASRLVFQDAVRARDVLEDGLRDLPRVLAARLARLVMILGGLTLVMVVGVWVATTFLFVTEVMLLERSPVRPGFVRSQRIAMTALSEVLLGCLVLAAVPIASIVLADVAGRSILGELLQFTPPRPLWVTGGGALAMIGLFAQVPYVATARFFLYLNVRTRAEGWDVQTRFHAIAARAVAEDRHAEARTNERASAA